MQLREAQFHKQNPILAQTFQTIFDDLIVGREDIGEVTTQMYSYDKYVKDTIVTVFILRAEIISILGENGNPLPNQVEALGFCYPRQLEQKIIDVAQAKNYDVVFKVPNGIKDLETVEVKNLRLQSPQFADLFNRFFTNQHYYILNQYDVYGDPQVNFAPPPPLTEEEEAEAKAYDNFCMHDLPKYEKAQSSLIKEIGVALQRIPLLYGRFRLKRKESAGVLVTSGATNVNLNAADYEERKVDHDLYFTFVGDKVETLEKDTFTGLFKFVSPAFIRVPHYMETSESKVIEPIRFEDMDIPSEVFLGEDGDDDEIIDTTLIQAKPVNPSLTIDADLYPTMWRIEDAFLHVNGMVTKFIDKWSYHPELVEKTINILNTFLLVGSNKQDLLYSFNDVSIIESHLNRVLQRIDEMKVEQNKVDAEWGLDPDSWKLWDYANPDEPTLVSEWYLDEELFTHYSESYVHVFTEYVRSVPHPSIRVYTVVKQVPEDEIATHAIGSVRQVTH